MSAPPSRTAAPADDVTATSVTAARPPVLAVVVAAVLDVAAVLVFVVLGRRSHEDDEGVGNVVEIAGPFLIALAVGWAVLRMWRRPLWSTRAIGLWAITVGLGMVVRHVLFDRGTAATFIVVTAAVFAVFMLGWRLVATQVLPRPSA